MRTTIFEGNFFDIGRQQGVIYSKNGMDLKRIKISPKLFQAQLDIYKKYYPELLEEFEGMTLGGNFDKNKLIYNFICGEILWYTRKFNFKKACTIFGVKNNNGVFIGRNYDWAPITEKIFEVYKIINPMRNSFVAITDMGIDSEAETKPKYLYYNADDAINDKGLFISLTFAYNNKWSYGLSCIHMTKLIAETCSTLNEALKVFEKVPLCCPKNFFIADKDGEMAVVEHTSKKFKIIYPKNNVLIKTNHYIDPELAEEDTVLYDEPTHNTFIRYYETLQRVNKYKDNFRFSTIIKISGDKNSCICQDSPNIRTIWSLALDVKKTKYKLYWNLLGNRKSKVII